MDSVKFARKSAKYRPGDFRTITSQPVNCQLHNEKQWSFGLEHSSNTGSTFNRRKLKQIYKPHTCLMYAVSKCSKFYIFLEKTFMKVL